jgi:hypothetical protein
MSNKYSIPGISEFPDLDAAYSQERARIPRHKCTGCVLGALTRKYAARVKARKNALDKRKI